jgi:hypothetical protein
LLGGDLDRNAIAKLDGIRGSVDDHRVERLGARHDPIDTVEQHTSDALIAGNEERDAGLARRERAAVIA